MLTRLLEQFLNECMKPASIEEITAPSFQIILEKDAFTELSKYLDQHMEEAGPALEKIQRELLQMDVLKACHASYFCSNIIKKVGVTDTSKNSITLFLKAVNLAEAYLKKLSKLQNDSPQMTHAERISYLYENALSEMKGYIGAQVSALAVLTLIQLDRQIRDSFKTEAPMYLLIQLQEYIHNIRQILQVYRVCSYLPVTVLCPETLSGIQAEANDIANNFHLFTLLEAELYRKGLDSAFLLKDFQFEQDIYEYATGKAENCLCTSLQLHQQYYTYKALICNDSYEITNGYKLSPENSLIWGEAAPDQIPLFDNQALILMDQRGMVKGRVWDTKFLHKNDDGCRPDLKITKLLSKSDVLDLLGRIKNRSIQEQ